MDPRRPGYDPYHKRKRDNGSPSNARHHKTNQSRRSSASNSSIASEVPAGAQVSNNSQRPSEQQQVEILGKNGVGPAENPSNGSGSQFGQTGDSPNMQSTSSIMPEASAFRQNNGLSSRAGAIAKDGEIDSTGGTSPFFDMLMAFSEHVTSVATYKMAQDQAEARFDRANAEYNSTKKDFSSFPSIKEQKTFARDVAERDLRLRQEKVAFHQEAQKSLARDFATLIGQNNPDANPNMNANATENATFVSHRQYEELDKRYTGLEKGVKQLLGSVAELSESFATIKETMEKVYPITSTTNTYSIENGSIMGDVDILKKRQQELARQMAQFKASRFESDKRSSDIAQHSASTQPLGLDTETKSMVEKLVEEGPALIETVQQMKEELASISSVVSGGDDWPSNSLVEKHDNIRTAMHQMQNDIEVLRSAMSQLKAGVEEEGKDSVVKRLRVYDRLINDLSTQTDEQLRLLLSQRVSALERYHKELEGKLGLSEDMRDLPPRASTETVANRLSRDELDELNKRVAKVEIDVEEAKTGIANNAQGLNSHETTLDASTESILSTIETHIGKQSREVIDVKTSIDDLRGRVEYMVQRTQAAVNARSTEITHLDGKFASWHKSMLSMKQDVYGKAAKTDVEDLKAALGDISLRLEETKRDYATCAHLNEAVTGLRQSLHGEIHSEASRNELAMAITKLLQDPNRNPVHFARLSSALPHNLPGSPLTGRVHSPQFPPPTGQPPLRNLAEELDGLKSKTEQLTYTTQRLQVQYNNLTTEEVVQQMVGQMSTMYPDVKDCQGSVDAVRAKHDALESVLRETVATWQRLERDVQTALERAGRAEEAARATQPQLAALTAQLAQPAAPHAPDPSPASAGAAAADVAGAEDLKRRIDAISAAAQEARAAARQVADLVAAMDVPGLRHEAAEARYALDGLAATARTHDDWLRRGQEQVQSVVARTERSIHLLALSQTKIAALEEVFRAKA